ncbi:MAG TPA: thioesterase family protein [Ramlibacter sp.]|nr:thioesterase family protein [Ramlibacter sp.]
MKFDIPEKKKLVYELVTPIRWGDMDAMGHVNNGSYFRYMESCRFDWLRAIGAQPDGTGVGVVLMNAFCTFHQQLEYPGDVLVRMYVSDVGRSSFETWVTMARADQPDVLCASGGATTVWVDYARHKSAPLPDSMRAHLE